MEKDFIPRNMRLIAGDGQEVGTYSYGFPTKLTLIREGVYLVEQINAEGNIVSMHIYGSEKDYNGKDNPPERQKKIAEIIQSQNF